MDLKNMLNDTSVDPTPRRFSSSHDSISLGRNDSIFSARTDSIVSMPGRKRSRSPSDAGRSQPEPSPKRLRAKRQRPMEPPMWARRWSQMWQQEHGAKKANGFVSKHEPAIARAPSNAPPPSQAVRSSPAAPPKQEREIPVRPSTASTDRDPIRSERTYKNVEPIDELSRVIMDFIYREVIENGLIDDPGPETEIEIEAKLGTIIDKDKDSRLARWPILNECAINDLAGVPIAFRSSMTEQQHQYMNNHLNKAVQDSLRVGSDRQRMKYIHLRERDRFYELPNDVARDIPLRIRSKLKSKPRVRITYDQKTDEIKAAIIKIRLADQHVFCPKSEFDWRISISLEMNYRGDLGNLTLAQDAGVAKNGRDKDRLSYEHQGIKIDLTQVTMDGGKEHELEFELPSDALRIEANNMRSGRPHDYPGLIRNFVDDIRIATREFPR